MYLASFQHRLAENRQAWRRSHQVRARAPELDVGVDGVRVDLGSGAWVMVRSASVSNGDVTYGLDQLLAVGAFFEKGAVELRVLTTDGAHPALARRTTRVEGWSTVLWLVEHLDALLPPPGETTEVPDALRHLLSN